MRSWGLRRAFRRLVRQAVEVGTGGVRTRVSLAPETLEHECGQKVSVKCGMKSYQYRAKPNSRDSAKHCAPLVVRVSGQETREKSGDGTEGGDGGVGCGGNFPGDRFAYDRE
jgi:hypothetical protein